MLTIPASKLVSADLIMLKPIHQAQQWLTTPIFFLLLPGAELPS
jgi:hypothetical protein